MKKIYIEKTEEINFDELTEREKAIYISGQDNPPVYLLIAFAFACILLGMAIGDSIYNYSIN